MYTVRHHSQPASLPVRYHSQPPACQSGIRASLPVRYHSQTQSCYHHSQIFTVSHVITTVRYSPVSHVIITDIHRSQSCHHHSQIFTRLSRVITTVRYSPQSVMSSPLSDIHHSQSCHHHSQIFTRVSHVITTVRHSPQSVMSSPQSVHCSLSPAASTYAACAGALLISVASADFRPSVADENFISNSREAAVPQ